MGNITQSERLRVALAMRKACADKCESMSPHQPMADGYRADRDSERIMARAISNIDPLDIVAALDGNPAPDLTEQEAFERAAVLEHFPVDKRDNGEYFHPITARLHKVWKMAVQFKADATPSPAEEPMNTMKEVVTQLAQEYRAPDSAVIADAMIATAGARLVSASTGGIAAEVVAGSLLNCSPSALPTLKLGVIVERLGFVVTAEFLASLGFAHSKADKQPGKLYHEADFPRICAALRRHIVAVQAAH